MVVVGALRGGSAAVVTDEFFGGGDDLQGFFDDAAMEVATTGGEDGKEEELEWLSNKDAFPTVDTMAPPAEAAGLETALPRTTKGVLRPGQVVASSPPPALSPRPRAPAKAGRRCRHCGTEETPQWRKGPEGAQSLCNACGMRYRAGKLLPEYRPAKSPTFSPVLHSNRHRRVVELARRREEESAKAFPAAAAGD